MPTIKVLDNMKEPWVSIMPRWRDFLWASMILSFLMKSKRWWTRPRKMSSRIERLYREGTISARERFNRVVEIWGTTTDKVSVCHDRADAASQF